MAPVIAVGRITNKLVPKLTRMAIVGSTPIHFNIQNCTGTMINAPPTPSRPDAKPVSRPAASSTSIWSEHISVMKFPISRYVAIFVGCANVYLFTET